MPPGKEKQPNDAQKTMLRKWVEEGATDDAMNDGMPLDFPLGEVAWPLFRDKGRGMKCGDDYQRVGRRSAPAGGG
jgi:hypothetical protein